jgi:hypothetical protein
MRGSEDYEYCRKLGVRVASRLHKRSYSGDGGSAKLSPLRWRGGVATSAGAGGYLGFRWIRKHEAVTAFGLGTVERFIGPTDKVARLQ